MPEDGPSQVAKRAAARGAKEGSMVVSTVKETAETPLRACEIRLILTDGSENRLQNRVGMFLNRRSDYFALFVVDGHRCAYR